MLAGEALGQNGVGDFALARLTTAGALDPSFGGTGKVTTDLGAVRWAAAVSVEPSGRIVATGSSVPTSANGVKTAPERLAMAGYLPTGALDPTFGAGGKVVTNPVAPDDFHARSMATQGDGRLVVAGTALPANGNGDVAVARLSPDGIVDTTFGTGGVVPPTSARRAQATRWPCRSTAGWSWPAPPRRSPRRTPPRTTSSCCAERTSPVESGRLVLAGYATGTQGFHIYIAADP